MFSDSFWYRLWNYIFGAIVIATAIIWMVLLSTAVTKQPAVGQNEAPVEVKQEKNLKVEEIVRMAHESKLHYRGLQHQRLVLENAVGVTCTLVTSDNECIKVLDAFAGDKDILDALKKIRDGGVEIEVSWYKPGDSNVYIHEQGVLRIHESITLEELRRVLVSKQ